ncbi:MAG TPA: alpha/beta family hydrolase [Myxococcota bacterium]|nr:alpha/beta family hydrolase [Myxococcota bacterium]
MRTTVTSAEKFTRSVDLHFEVSRAGQVSALWLRPERARAALALAHGAGAGMRHAFMESVAERLAARGIATLRYQFPYMERGTRRPDPPSVAVACVRAAAEVAQKEAGDLPLFAGGKSYGGRMTSTAAAQTPLPGVRGLVFLGFPLHASGRPGSERATHLQDVSVPMLFLQGTRDPLADLALVRPLCASLGERAQLHVVDGGDHSFHVLKSSGRSDDAVQDELADAIAGWMDT